MRNKKKLWHKPPAYLLALLLLIAQSVPVWAGTAWPVPELQAVTQVCASTSGAASAHAPCLKDCCRHVKHCSDTCDMQLTASTLNMLPVSLHMYNPRYSLYTISQFQTPDPDGLNIAVLDRPPRQSL